ncbi:DUF459 domain-containing protein [Desulfolutivibrio sulfoxidireducens]|uniref:SGNH/GDSL hydrolase family protein n=1 Tax=Desulfolutivibrio sulfoxidireducens TaxID=2773299 RepID=UPI00159D1180|nr:DUF459 domain-containing protein [Desulfolutivibrio sulfoxidireducens]QLA20170.1 DUF459 domain-containing protein [Desulfolutivibrio sulfoxidireducens]
MRAPLRLSRITILAAVIGLALVIGCMRAMNQPQARIVPAGLESEAAPLAGYPGAADTRQPDTTSSPPTVPVAVEPDPATFSHMVEPLTARLFTIPEDARTPTLPADRPEPAATTVAALAPSAASPDAPRVPAPGAPVSPAPAAPDTAATGKTVKGPTRTVLVVGDSFAVGIGMTLAESLKPAKDVRLDQKGKTSSGLDNTKFHNWGKTLEGLLQSARPDALVVMVGGNDANNGPGTEVWAESYRHKASDFLSIAAKKGVPVYWVALPPMREEGLNARVKTTNAAMRAACESGGGCRFIDAWDLFTDEKGNFAAEKNIGGKTVKLRAKDGVHFTMAGYRLLSDRILAGFAPNLEVSLNK